MTVGKGMASRLNDRIRIEAPAADDSLLGAGAGSWTHVADVAADIVDALPSRAEKLGNGINVAARPARVRIRWRTDVTPAMRFDQLSWDGTAWVPAGRTMQIVSGPAEVGRREYVEFMVEDYSSAGNPA